jgi:hypothetical protein
LFEYGIWITIEKSKGSKKAFEAGSFSTLGSVSENPNGA